MSNIYKAIQNLYNMDKTTWQEVLAELYNLVTNIENKFDLFENKFGSLLGKEVTKELKKIYNDGSLASLINDKLLKDINTKVDAFKTEVSEQLDTITNIIRNFGNIYVSNEILLMDNATSYLQNIIDTNNFVNIILPSGTININRIIAKSYINIKGSGTTILKQIENTDSDLIVGIGTIQMFGLEDITIDGNKKNQTRSNKGINMLLSFSASEFIKSSIYKEQDAKHRYKNVKIYDCKGGGMYIEGRGESHFDNININRCDAYGMHLNSYDNWLNNISVGESGEEGIKITTSNCRFVNCKSWMNGLKNQLKGFGFSIGKEAISNTFFSCEAQDNSNHGFFIDGNANMFNGIYSDSNGWIYPNTLYDEVSGIYVNGNNNIINGLSSDRYLHRNETIKQSYGVYLSQSCKNNNINVICVDNKLKGVFINNFTFDYNKINATVSYDNNIIYEDNSIDSKKIYSLQAPSDKYFKIATVIHKKKYGIDPILLFDYTTSTGFCGNLFYTSKQKAEIGKGLADVKLINKQINSINIDNKAMTDDKFFINSYIKDGNTYIEILFKPILNERLNLSYNLCKNFGDSYEIIYENKYIDNNLTEGTITNSVLS